MTNAVTGASAGTSTLSSIFSAMRANFMQRADSDKSGTISLDEFLSTGQKVPGGKDGQADSAEKAKALFARIDTDGDGSLTTSELDSYEQQLVSSLQAALTQLQELLGQPQQGRRLEPPSLSADFEAIDADSDGAASREELTAYLVAMGMDEEKAAKRVGKLLNKADTDGDGVVSQAEAAAFDQARQARFEARNDRAGASQPLMLLIEALQENAAAQGGASASLAGNGAYSRRAA
ncbi:MAG: hypothetical protein ACK4YX_06000 [Rhabdaerophilum calidifontis]